MIEFGQTLREAREAKGYTIGQLADATHLMHQIIEDMENENFSKIAAPIYGRGFVKLYCEAVGLDPKPLIAEYMAIANGERPAAIHVRKPAAAPAAPAATTPAPTPAPAATTAPAPFSAPSPTPAPAPKPQSLPLPEAELDDAPLTAPVKRYAPLRPPAPLPDPKPAMNMPKLPANAWRVAVVVGVAAVLLWVLAIGIRALYRATMSAPEEEAKSTEAVEMAVPAQPVEQAPGGERTPIDIPPLYID